MLDQIQRVGGVESSFSGPTGPLGGQLGGACARCNKHQKEMLKAHLDPQGEFLRDGMKAKQADMKSKLSLLKGDLLGAAFYDRMSKKAQYEMGMDYAAGLNGVQGLGANPFLR